MLHRMVQISATQKMMSRFNPTSLGVLYNLALNKSHRHHLLSLQNHLYIYCLYTCLANKWFKPSSTVASSCGVVSTGNLVHCHEDPTSPTWLMNAKTQSMEQIPNLMVATWQLARSGGSFVAGVVGEFSRWMEDVCLVCLSLNTVTLSSNGWLGVPGQNFEMKIEELELRDQTTLRRTSGKEWEKASKSSFSWVTGYDVIVQCDSDDVAVSAPSNPQHSLAKPRLERLPWDARDFAFQTGANHFRTSQSTFHSKDRQTTCETH